MASGPLSPNETANGSEGNGNWESTMSGCRGNERLKNPFSDAGRHPTTIPFSSWVNTMRGRWSNSLGSCPSYKFGPGSPMLTSVWQHYLWGHVRWQTNYGSQISFDNLVGEGAHWPISAHKIHSTISSVKQNYSSSRLFSVISFLSL
jgi:hypothetical protein